MAKKVHYGKKKLLAKIEKNGYECGFSAGSDPDPKTYPHTYDIKLGENPPKFPKTVKKGYFLMTGNADTLSYIRERGYLSSSEGHSLETKQCFCTECQHTFDLDKTLTADSAHIESKPNRDPNDYQYRNSIKLNDGFYKSDEDQRNADFKSVKCPDCGAEMTDFGALLPIYGAPIENHINKNGAYIIPEEATGRYLFEYRDDNGELTRVDDNTMVRTTIIYPSGKEFHYNAEYSKSNDLIKRSETITKTALIGDERTPVAIKSAIDSFEYPKPKNAYQKDMPDIVKMHSRCCARSAADNTLEEMMSSCRDMDIENGHSWNEQRNIDKLNHFMQDMQVKLIENNFDLEDPVMCDSSRNGMYLTEVKADSNEHNTEQNYDRKTKYLTLMTKYPAAFEYAAMRAHNRSVNYEFEQKRRAEADPEYTAKAPTDKYKAKLMREELNFVAEQLTTCDDKVLQTIRESKDYDDMKNRLKAISLGDVSGLEDDAKMHIDVRGAKTDSVSGKKLKKSFKLDPIGTAHNVYTAKKLGLKTIDDINRLNDIGHEQSPDLNPAPIRIKGKYKTQDVRYKNNVNAGMVAPIRNQNQMRFMRNFANTHSTADVFEIYENSDKFDLCNECINMYHNVCQHAVLLDNEKAKDPAVATAMHEFIKKNVEDYLQQHSVQDAYINYVSKYGAKTPETINQYIAELKFDEKLPEVRQYADEHGKDAAIKKYSEEHNSTETNKIENIESYIENRLDDKYLTYLNGKQIVSTKNEKPLFNNRTLREIHDELSNINRKMVTENIDLSDCYPQEIKDMEKDYPAPDGSGTWKFRCHKDSFDVVNSATALHNCLGSTHVQNMRYGSMWVMYMENELGHRVAAIELKRNHGDADKPFAINQFQADHDTSLPAHYAGVAKQWLTECNIEHENNSNVKAFGKDIAFYGGGNADYHHYEIDDVEGEQVTVDERAKRQLRRREEAKRLYKYDEATDSWDFGVTVPEYTKKVVPASSANNNASNSAGITNPEAAAVREIPDTPNGNGPGDGDGMSR